MSAATAEAPASVRTMNSTVARIAQWLYENIDEGAVFTRDDLAAAADTDWDKAERRLRDLPRVGWVYHTRRNDPTLKTGEYRLVKVGAHVWEAGVRRPPPNALSHLRDLHLDALDEEQLRTFAGWVAAGERPDSPIDAAWEVYRRLSPAAQRKAKAILFDRLIGD